MELILTILVAVFSTVTAILQFIKSFQKKDFSLLASTISRVYLTIAVVMIYLDKKGFAEIDFLLAVAMVMLSDLFVHGLYFVAKKYKIEIEARRNVQQLKELNSKYAILVENAIVGYYVLDGNGLIEYVNPRFATILCSTKEAIIGKSIFDFVAKDDIPMVKENIRKRMEGEISSITYTLNLLNDKGQHVKVRVYGGKTTNGHDTITGIMIPAD